MRNLAFNVSLIIVMVLAALSVSLPTAKAGDVVPLNWTSPTTSPLYSVFMVSASDGWAVGIKGTIIHWDGTNWSSVTSPFHSYLSSVSMVSSSDGWAVGYVGTIIRWTGTEWVPEFPTAILTPLLFTITLVTVTLIKTASKKHRENDPY